MPVNQQKVTKELCERVTVRGERLYIPVTTKEEAQNIQLFFFNLGYGWYKSGCIGKDVPIHEGNHIYLDADKTLMQGAYSESPQNWLCTVQQLDPKALSAEHEVMMEEIREMQRSFKEEIAGLKAEILALKNEINPPMEKKAQMPSVKKDTRSSSDAPSGSPV